MTLANLPGGFAIPIGLGESVASTLPTSGITTTLDAANEACIMIGHIVTADGASHTIDTTGASSIQWRANAVTFANAGTTVKVGLAAVDLANGPAPRAVNSTNVITFDVSRSMTGGGGGIAANAWQTHVPDAGSKTIANGDLVAMAVQMTARGGTDSVALYTGIAPTSFLFPSITQYIGGAYGTVGAIPNAIIVFSDGTLGWFYGGEVASTHLVRTFSPASSPDEAGQLFNLPFPYRVAGIYAWVDPDSSFDLILYSDPLGTPVAQRTVSVDPQTVSVAAGRKLFVPFASSYDVAANTNVAVTVMPIGGGVSCYHKRRADAAHRVTDPFGTSGHGVTRSDGSGAFASSSLDDYFIGLLVSGFGDDAGGGGGGGLSAPLFGGGVL